MTKDEALDLALEALEASEYYIDDLEAIVYAADDLGTDEDRTKMQEAIAAIKQARSAPVQEPVAVVGEDKHGPFVDWLGDRSSFYERNPVGTKFYTAPPAQPAPVQPVAMLNGIKRYEPEIFREDRIRMELDQSGEWVKYADVELLITAPPAAKRQCNWPTCQSEEYQQSLAEQIKQELVTGAAQPAPDYAWPTVADYEKDVGFEVNEAFKMAWAMARTTNALFT